MSSPFSFKTFFNEIFSLPQYTDFIHTAIILQLIIKVPRDIMQTDPRHKPNYGLFNAHNVEKNDCHYWTGISMVIQ